jgi:hypothetical protein
MMVRVSAIVMSAENKTAKIIAADNAEKTNTATP